MLRTSTSLTSSELSPNPIDEPSAAEIIAGSIGVIRRQLFVVVLFALIGATLGAIFFVKAEPKYTATATLLVDTHKMDLVQQPAVYSDMSLQSMGVMESQVELLKSGELARRVIQNLKLSNDPRFIGGRGEGALHSLLRRLAPDYFGEQPKLSDGERQNLALEIFTKNLYVARVGVTYAMEIDFESRYPDLAAKVANAVAEAYIDLQRTTQYDAAHRASDWLEERIPELRSKSEDAQKAVVEYKEEHQLVEDGSGRLVDEQRLTAMNDKLNTAHDDVLKGKARFDQFSAGKSLEVPSAAIGADASSGPSGFLDKLRSEYLDVVSKEAESSAKLGPNNPVIISLQNQKVQLRSEMAKEIQRLKDASGSDYAAAQLREFTLRKEFEAAVTESQQKNQAQVRLRELEASAHAYQDLYNTFISRYNASLQQAASPIAEASIITFATPNIKIDYKKPSQMAALFPVGAIALGLGVAFLREFLGNRVFLTSKSVQSHLRVGCIGLLPKLERVRARPRWRQKMLPGPRPPRTLARGRYDLSWTVVEYPLIQFSEGVRSVMFAVDLEIKSTSHRVFGLTSATPDEGKSTIALAMGLLSARNGASVIVVDCDLRNPSLTRSLAPGATSGIVELAQGRALLEDVIWTDAATGMAFLPAMPHIGPTDSASILASPKIKQLFDELHKKYDFVLVDLSPIGAVVDVCATTEFVDAYLFVIEWGRTTVDVVQHALRAAPLPDGSILGAVLNKADVKTLRTYAPYLKSYYFQNDRQ